MQRELLQHGYVSDNHGKLQFTDAASNGWFAGSLGE
jgi:hypothetical protein